MFISFGLTIIRLINVIVSLSEAMKTSHIFLPCINQKNQSNVFLECVWSLAKYTSLLIWTSKLIMGLPLPKRWKIVTNWTYFLLFFTIYWWVDQCKFFHFFYIKFLCSSNKDLVQPQALKFWLYTFLDVFCKLSSLGYKNLCFPSMEVHILHLIWWILPLLSITLSHQCRGIVPTSLKCIYPPWFFCSLFSETFGLNDSTCIFSQLRFSFMQIDINSVVGGDLDLYMGRWDWI